MLQDGETPTQVRETAASFLIAAARGADLDRMHVINEIEKRTGEMLEFPYRKIHTEHLRKILRAMGG